MRRRLVAVFLSVCVVCFLIAAGCMGAGALQARPLDVGNYNDYGGGNYGGGYNGGNYGGDYGGDYGGGVIFFGGDDDGDGSGGGGIGIVVGIFVLLVILILVFDKMKKAKRPPVGPGSMPVQQPQNHEASILPAITQVDPNFSNDKFIAWTKEVFITLQQAWTARDWSKIRPFEKEELFRQHEMQLQEYIQLNRINIIERINIRQAYLHKYVRDNQYEYLTVYMSTRMVDYIIDEQSRKVLKGDPNTDCYLDYVLTFMRKTGVKTKDAASTAVSKSCPHCGAPMQVTSAGKCEYCGSIITTGEFDWVLAEMDAVKPGVHIDNTGVIIQDDGAQSEKDKNEGDRPQ